jgi:hypothetical protein
LIFSLYSLEIIKELNVFVIYSENNYDIFIFGKCEYVHAVLRRAIDYCKEIEKGELIFP